MANNETLIRKIELERMETRMLIQIADLAIRHSEIVSAQIEASMAKSDAEVEEARDVLRRAGLLRD